MRILCKELLRIILYLIKRKSYKIKIHNNYTSLKNIRDSSAKEYFFGYYDQSPERNGRVLMHEMQQNGESVKVIVKKIATGEEHIIAETKAFNWQMGCRALWVDDDIVSYNDFDGVQYVCRWYSLSHAKVIKTFLKPLQDYSSISHLFIGVNYQRLYNYTKEYGYNCLPKMTEEEFCDYSHDGLWKVDIKTGNIELLISITEILKFEPEYIKSGGRHFVNHVMISPDGLAFIFIHRYYVGKERYDRLLLWRNGNLKSLLGRHFHSHYCWLDNNHVFGYGEYQNKKGFHSIDIVTGNVTCYPELDTAHPSDGHPTYNGDWIVIDGYPDLSRMQQLIGYQLSSRRIIKIGEFFHDLSHKDNTRCDLHPRFTEDGRRIYFDTIYSGKRQLCYLELK